jgi:hypothetical protein
MVYVVIGGIILAPIVIKLLREHRRSKPPS